MVLRSLALLSVLLLVGTGALGRASAQSPHRLDHSILVRRNGAGALKGVDGVQFAVDVDSDDVNNPGRVILVSPDAMSVATYSADWDPAVPLRGSQDDVNVYGPSRFDFLEFTRLAAPLIRRPSQQGALDCQQPPCLLMFVPCEYGVAFVYLDGMIIKRFSGTISIPDSASLLRPDVLDVTESIGFEPDPVLNLVAGSSVNDTLVVYGITETALFRFTSVLAGTAGIDATWNITMNRTIIEDAGNMVNRIHRSRWGGHAFAFQLQGSLLGQMVLAGADDRWLLVPAVIYPSHAPGTMIALLYSLDTQRFGSPLVAGYHAITSVMQDLGGIQYGDRTLPLPSAWLSRLSGGQHGLLFAGSDNGLMTAATAFTFDQATGLLSYHLETSLTSSQPGHVVQIEYDSQWFPGSGTDQELVYLFLEDGSVEVLRAHPGNGTFSPLHRYCPEGNTGRRASSESPPAVAETACTSSSVMTLPAGTVVARRSVPDGSSRRFITRVTGSEAHSWFSWLGADADAVLPAPRLARTALHGDGALTPFLATPRTLTWLDASSFAVGSASDGSITVFGAYQSRDPCQHQRNLDTLEDQAFVPTHFRAIPGMSRISLLPRHSASDPGRSAILPDGRKGFVFPGFLAAERSTASDSMAHLLHVSHTQMASLNPANCTQQLPQVCRCNAVRIDSGTAASPEPALSVNATVSDSLPDLLNTGSRVIDADTMHLVRLANSSSSWCDRVTPDLPSSMPGICPAPYHTVVLLTESMIPGANATAPLFPRTHAGEAIFGTGRARDLVLATTVSDRTVNATAASAYPSFVSARLSDHDLASLVSQPSPAPGIAPGTTDPVPGVLITNVLFHPSQPSLCYAAYSPAPFSGLAEPGIAVLRVGLSDTHVPSSPPSNLPVHVFEPGLAAHLPASTASPHADAADGDQIVDIVDMTFRPDGAYLYAVAVPRSGDVLPSDVSAVQLLRIYRITDMNSGALSLHTAPVLPAFVSSLARRRVITASIAAYHALDVASGVPVSGTLYLMVSTANNAAQAAERISTIVGVDVTGSQDEVINPADELVLTSTTSDASDASSGWSEATSAHVSPDGRYLIVLSDTGSVTVFAAGTAARPQPVLVQFDLILAVSALVAILAGAAMTCMLLVRAIARNKHSDVGDDILDPTWDPKLARGAIRKGSASDTSVA